MHQAILIDCHGETDAGTRERNEDQFLIASLNKTLIVQETSLSYDNQTWLQGGAQGKLLLVADGMGGHQAGDHASALAVTTVTRYVLNTMSWFYGLDQRHEDDLTAELRSALLRCQQAMEEAADGRPGRQGMGTTLTMAYVLWPRMYVVHAGDSRCYLQRAGVLRQLTRDHTFAQRLVDDGQVKEKDVSSSRLDNILWNVISADSSAELRPEVSRVKLQSGDAVLLCSDGLNKHVNDAAISRVLHQGESAEAMARTLVRRANQDGGSDNITVVIARFAAPEIARARG